MPRPAPRPWLPAATRRAVLAGAGALLVACTLDPFQPTIGDRDAGRRDASPPSRDAGRPDAGPSDAAPADTGVDAGGPDACAAPELCNGVDDDCDPSTPDGADEPTLGDACDGADADLCEEGTIVCAGGALTCDDATSDDGESCNAADDDCDGSIDETGCPCEHRERGTSTYQFCATPVSWNDARLACATYGYSLVTIEDALEDEAVIDWAHAIDGMSDWWIGLNDRAVEGTFEWVSGSTAAYRQWSPTAPNDFLGGQDCVEISDGDIASETPRTWNDSQCSDAYPFICETP